EGWPRGLLGYLAPGPPLRLARIATCAATGRTVGFAAAGAAPAAPAEDIRHVDDRTVVAPDREIVGVAVGDRARRVHHLRTHDAADDAQPLPRRNRHTGRETGRYREIASVHHGNEKAALAHELLQLRDSHPA